VVDGGKRIGQVTNDGGARTGDGMRPSSNAIEVGAALPEQSFPVRRVDLVRYAGASGDFNPIHWNERFAKSVGLPDVIAHGMFTMATAIRVVTDWAGDPAAVVDYGVRFTRPVVVPDDGAGAVITVSATVTEKLPDNQVAIDLSAVSGGQRVLGRARAIVRLPA
jgi:acyl dehydratase